LQEGVRGVLRLPVLDEKEWAQKWRATL
jgi:hypothetical protein